MSDELIRPLLSGQKALIVGIANDQSIAYGCAKAFREVGADLAITWLNEKGRPYVRIHPNSPGPLKTRAASGLRDFELLLNEAEQKAPLGELVDIIDVGFACAYLAMPFARRHRSLRNAHGWERFLTQSGTKAPSPKSIPLPHRSQSGSFPPTRSASSSAIQRPFWREVREVHITSR